MQRSTWPVQQPGAGNTEAGDRTLDPQEAGAGEPDTRCDFEETLFPGTNVVKRLKIVNQSQAL